MAITHTKAEKGQDDHLQSAEPLSCECAQELVALGVSNQ